MTPVQLAAYNDCRDIAQYLLKYSKNISILVYRDVLLLGTVKFLAEELKCSSEITGLSLAHSKLLFIVTLLNI